MPHLKSNFLYLHLIDIKNDIRFGFYVHELYVNLNWEILGSEGEDIGMTSTKWWLEHYSLFFTADWHSNFDHTPVMVNFEQER